MSYDERKSWLIDSFARSLNGTDWPEWGVGRFVSPRLFKERDNTSSPMPTLRRRDENGPGSASSLFFSRSLYLFP
eukprot:CAMPEP_0203801406 /NCGR_PEP_ID=MMETSP0100_2-20121128/11277_1 /ASSEMBLY_ACC=CAM_ASM_000210 /TAXON_ID=96639 /ORGANISM=" , Strain NY0313808BC1" /LENGTH=74 /DNA_ID=CAMNT_0050708041 /DNA_START=309 /DNA_END=529 /DNA_ORIENTATION=-